MRIIWQVAMLLAALVALAAGFWAFVAAYHIYTTGPAGMASTQLFWRPGVALALAVVTLPLSVWFILHAHARLMR